MLMTVLEARVAADGARNLEQAYREGSLELPPGIVETFLVRDATDASLFRILTVWADRAALEAMRASGMTPKGVQFFQAAGATPSLSILEVLVRRL